MITSTYELIAYYGPPAAYNYWATLGLDVFNVIMWLSSFALLTSQVAPAFKTECYYGRCYKLTGVSLVIAATQMAAAALGGVELYGFLPLPSVPSMLPLPSRHPS